MNRPLPLQKVCDLHLPDSGWVRVRTEDSRPLEWSEAPRPADLAPIDARAMDMRDLKLPDDHDDFFWSTGAFGHIGEGARPT
jgi:hypothetical protein